MRIISSLPPEVTKLLFDAGKRIIVLVEGSDDRYVLREWFKEFLSEIEFYDCGGISNLNKWIEGLFSHGVLKRAYAITDRDFRTVVKSVTAANFAYFDENRAQYQISGQTAFYTGSTMTTS